MGAPIQGPLSVCCRQAGEKRPSAALGLLPLIAARAGSVGSLRPTAFVVGGTTTLRKPASALHMEMR